MKGVVTPALKKWHMKLAAARIKYPNKSMAQIMKSCSKK